MKKSLVVLALVVLSISLALYGCGAKKAASGSEAIEATKSMDTLDEKMNYLISQAKAFTNSKEYNDAVVSAQYILTNLDRNSAEARKILDAARKEIEAQAQKTVDEMKNKLGSLGK